MDSYTIENFLTDEQEQEIENLTIHPMFPWFFTPATITDVKDGVDCGTVIEKGINPFQFVHEVDIKNCNYFNVIAPVLNFVATELNSNIIVIRSKFNLLPKLDDYTHHYPHLDVYDTDDVYSAIYYVNDSDGDTYFFDSNVNIEKTISPKKGKLVLFNSNTFHSSSSPIKNEYRIVLNLVFKKLSEES